MRALGTHLDRHMELERTTRICTTRVPAFPVGLGVAGRQSGTHAKNGSVQHNWQHPTNTHKTLVFLGHLYRMRRTHAVHCNTTRATLHAATIASLTKKVACEESHAKQTSRNSRDKHEQVAPSVSLVFAHSEFLNGVAFISSRQPFRFHFRHTYVDTACLRAPLLILLARLAAGSADSNRSHQPCLWCNGEFERECLIYLTRCDPAFEERHLFDSSWVISYPLRATCWEW